VELKGAKHPILAILREDTVPVDILLKEKKGLILTGPNTGGKTVSLKTLGLIALMFQSAIPVPVSEDSSLPVFRNIFVDIGDEQSIEQNLSSFSSHVSNLSEFLADVEGDSLVLLDELGAGTDPMEGSALAIGILEFLKGKGAWVFANTHHTPVKLYAVNSDYYTPASVLFDPITLNPLYRIAYNSVGESMAFEIARRYGLPQEVVDKAKEVIGNLGESYREATRQLSEYVREYESKLREIELKEMELREKINRYEELIREYEHHKQRAWKDIYGEAKSFLRKLREESRKLGEREKQDMEEFLKRSEKQLKLFIKEDPPKLMVGDWVRFMGKEGRVLKLSGDRAYIVSGSFKFWVDVSNLEKIDKPAEKVYVKLKGELPGKRLKEINLVGMDAQEARFALEKFLEEAYSAGLKSVRIVHGVGTGKLRSTVRQVLSSHERVKFFRDAYPKEGGSGATIVYFS
jgi:DNA mismatch repair protein MutS2